MDENTIKFIIKMKASQPSGVSTFAITHGLIIYSGVRELRFAQANAQTKNCKRAFTFPSL